MDAQRELFTVFSYHVHRPNSQSSRAVGAAVSVNDFLSTQATANDDFTLSVRCTNMTPEQESSLRSFILRRISKGAVYSGAGQTGKVDNYFCYYCLVRKEMPSNAEPDFYSQEYVICLLHTFAANNEEEFDLFRPELDSFCSQIGNLLFQRDSSPNPVNELLTQWVDINLNYITRVLAVIGDSLHRLLCAVLEGRSLLIESSKEIADDVCKFCVASSILSLLQSSDISGGESTTFATYQHVVPGQEVPDNIISALSGQDLSDLEANEVSSLTKIWQTPLRVQIDPDGHCVFYEQSGTVEIELRSEFCEGWASKLCATFQTIKQMNEAENNIKNHVIPSLHLRRIIETFKIKAIQEVTMLRRLVRKAEVDHYALYTCLRQLRDHNNRDVLMSIILRESLLLQPNADTRQVVLILYDFLKRGVADWPPLPQKLLR